MGFVRVKQILDQAISDWRQVNGDPDLTGRHTVVNKPE